MWNLKNNINKSIYKTIADLQTQKVNLWLAKGKERGGIKQYRINRCTLLYIKWMSDMALLYSTGTLQSMPCNNL